MLWASIESSSIVRVDVISDVVDSSLSDVKVGSTVISEVSNGEVDRSLELSTSLILLHPLIINNNAIIKRIILVLFFFTIISPFQYTF